jgi:hypothetical protein
MCVAQWMKLTFSGLGLALLAACATEVGPKMTPTGEAKSTKTPQRLN